MSGSQMSKMVPLEPTEQMIDAVYNHQPRFNCVAGHDLSSDELREIYKTMIDAAQAVELTPSR